jgi:hypothetical protein
MKRRNLKWTAKLRIGSLLCSFKRRYQRRFQHGRERRVSVHGEAPGFRLGPRAFKTGRDTDNLNPKP